MLRLVRLFLTRTPLPCRDLTFSVVKSRRLKLALR